MDAQLTAPIKALTFDCYGTLVDWESGLLDALRPWARRNSVDAMDEELLAAFAEAEPRCERAEPAARYTDVLRRVHDEIAKRFEVASSPADADAFASSVGDWPPFPDTTDALRRLGERFTLMIVSNVERASFARTQARLGIAFDIVLTAEDVGAYKPDRRMFDAALARLAQEGVGKADLLHVAQSLYHDHVPAKALGLRTAWVRRGRGPADGGATAPPGTDVRPDVTVETMAELADRLLC